MSSDQHLAKLIDVCKEYSYYDSYVYKLCTDLSDKEDKLDRWLVIFSKLNETKTNQNISNINNDTYPYAYICCDVLKVIKIIDIYDPINTKCKSQIICDEHFGKFKCEVGEIVRAVDYVHDDDGIYCFNTIEPAYYDREIPDNYTGKWNTWCSEGNKSEEENYKNGKKDGVRIIWHYSGKKWKNQNIVMEN